MKVILSVQVFFKKTLTCLQWSSLFILTFGCMLKYIQFDQSDSLNDNNDTIRTTENSRASLTEGEFGLTFNLALILIQVHIKLVTISILHSF